MAVGLYGIRKPTPDDPRPTYQIGYVAGNIGKKAVRGPEAIVVEVDLEAVVWADKSTNRSTPPSDGIEQFKVRKDWNPEFEMARNPHILNRYRIGLLYEIPGPERAASEIFTGFAKGTSEQITWQLNVAPVPVPAESSSQPRQVQSPGRFMIDGTDGKILAKPDSLGQFKASLLGVDVEGRTATVWSWAFKVEEKLEFSLATAWPSPDEAGLVAQKRYRLRETYLIDKPNLDRDELFVNPAGGAKSVNFVLRIFEDHVDGNQSLLCPGARCPGQYFVAPSGAVSLRTTTAGVYVGHLDAVDESGAIVSVRRWSFQALPKDTFDTRNGPNGRGCGDGALVDEVEFDLSFACDCSATKFEGENCDLQQDTANPTNGPNGQGCGPGRPVDDVPFDGAFICNCSDTKYEGVNCEVRSAETSMSDNNRHGWLITGVMVATIVVIVVLSAVAYKLRVQQIQRRARDFNEIAARIRENGDNSIDDSKLPREVKRSAVKMIRQIGEGAFGEVWFGYLDERIQANNEGRKGSVIPAYPVAIKTSKELTGNAADDMLMEATIMAQVWTATINEQAGALGRCVLALLLNDDT